MIFLIICPALSFGQEPLPESPPMLRQKHIESLISQMSLEEKVMMLSGNGFETIGNERLGVVPFKMADGPAGLTNGRATAFPVPIAMAATWDTSLVYKVGKAIAREARHKGRNVLLAPCLNILRHPLGGRNFECYGEDPLLAGWMATAFIKGVHSENVIACPKHFVCNNQEWNKYDINVLVSNRALREIYLPAFRMAVKEAGAGCIMAAYNAVNYAPCTENSLLLRDILKDEWAFQGFVMSDWFGTKSTYGAFHAGLDLEMPRGRYFNMSISDSVRSGFLNESMIDEKINRMLWARHNAGWFEQETNAFEDTLDLDEHNELALQAARQSIVLLKNQKGILPLDPDMIESVALIGPNTFEARTGGGGSSQVSPGYSVSPFQGIKNILSDRIRIRSGYGTAAKGDIIPLAPEYMRPYHPNDKFPGLKADYYANDKLSGVADYTRIDSVINFVWGYGHPYESLARQDGDQQFSVRWKGKLQPPVSGTYKLKVLCNGGCRLIIEDSVIIDEWDEHSTDVRSAAFEFKSEEEYDVVLEYLFISGIANIKFGWELPEEDLISAAVYHARLADVAIVFAGLSNRMESDGFDREQLELPCQDKLINAVVEANPNTIVVMQTGSPVVMEKWIRQVPAVLQAWYGGQEGGSAIAEVLFGEYNPSGRLPFTMGWKQNDYPAFNGYKNPNLVADYSEGIYVGYRYFDKEEIKPLFSFGHGLSYSTIGIGKLQLRRRPGTYNYFATVEMTNMGDLKGSEVLQLYIYPLESKIKRSEKELKRFKRVTLEPGERIVVKIPFDRTDFAHYNEVIGKWQIEPGLYEVTIGTSAENIKLRKRIEIK